MKTRFHRRRVAIAIAVGLCTALPLQARNLGPGESHTVLPGDAAEEWSLEEASIAMIPGSVATTVWADRSTVSIDGGTIGRSNDASSYGLYLGNGSDASVRNAAIIAGSRGIAVDLRHLAQGLVAGTECLKAQHADENE